MPKKAKAAPLTTPNTESSPTPTPTPTPAPVAAPVVQTVPTVQNDSLPKSEREGLIYLQRMSMYLKKNKAVFFQGEEDSSPRILLNNQLVSLDFNPENDQLSRLIQHSCQVSSLCAGAKSAIQRLRVHALNQAGTMRLRKFAAKSDTEPQLYLPLKDRTQLLCIGTSSTQTKIVENGKNTDNFWLEHPTGSGFEYRPGPAKDGLDKFEELCVRTQATEIPSMQWFLAMAEGLFPLVREYAKARFITAHIGSSQAGKTSGAQRFITLHGLGEVKGDCSIASLRSLGDCGLLCLDNKENRNFTHELVDHLLFLATGSESMRADRNGNLLKISSRRPVGVITSIEGVYTDELQRRMATVSYVRPTGAELSRHVEHEISAKRHLILSAFVPVLEQFLDLSKSPPSHGTCPIPGFADHYNTICDLLAVYGQVSGRPAAWSDGMIEAWSGQVSAGDKDSDNELEEPIAELLRMYENEWEVMRFEHLKQKGLLYITESGVLLSLLHKIRPHDHSIPRTATALARRLRSNRFLSFFVLDEDAYPETKELKRSRTRRPIGLFQPSYDVTN